MQSVLAYGAPDAKWSTTLVHTYKSVVVNVAYKQQHWWHCQCDAYPQEIL